LEYKLEAVFFKSGSTFRLLYELYTSIWNELNDWTTYCGNSIATVSDRWTSVGEPLPFIDGGLGGANLTTRDLRYIGGCHGTPNLLCWMVKEFQQSLPGVCLE
jgi:hypothetical protein